MSAKKYVYFKTNSNCCETNRNIFCQKYINCRATNSSEKWVYKPRQILYSWLKQNIASPRQSPWEICKFLQIQVQIPNTNTNTNSLCKYKHKFPIQIQNLYYKSLLADTKYYPAKTNPLGNIKSYFYNILVKQMYEGIECEVF